MTDTNANNRKKLTILNISDLPEADQNAIRAKYGTNMELVRQLNTIERLFLGNDAAFSQGLTSQYVYSFRSIKMLNPNDIMHMLRRFIHSNTALRTSYYKSSTTELLAIQQTVSMDLNTVSFHMLTAFTEEEINAELTHVLEAAQHQPINYANTFIPRLSFYSLDTHEYYMIVTQPAFFDSLWTPEVFIRTLLPEEELKVSIKYTSPNIWQITKGLNEKTNSSGFMLWKKYLSKLQPPALLPGHTHTNSAIKEYSTLHKSIPSEIINPIAQLLEKKSSTEWTSLLCISWAMIVKLFTKSNEVYFPIESTSDIAHDNMSEAEYYRQFFHHPVRMLLKGDTYFSELYSQTLGILSKTKNLPLPNKQDVYAFSGQKMPNYLISFRNLFLKSKESIALYSRNNPDRVYSNTFDNSLDYTISFELTESGMDIIVLHNSYSISSESLEQALDYLQTMLRFIPKHWSSTLAALELSVRPHESSSLNRSQSMLLSQLLRKTPLFKSATQFQLSQMTRHSHVYQLTKYEVVQSVGEHQDNILFLLNGDVIRQKMNQEGWLAPLNIVHAGDLINIQNLCSRESKQYAEVVSDKATIATIPVEDLKELINMSNDIGMMLIQDLLQSLDHYEDLWLTV